MDFRALEQRNNKLIESKLSNRSAVYNGVAIKVIFDRTYLETIGISNRKPVVNVNTHEVPNIKQESILNIDCIDYKVDEFEEDGTGRTTLILSKAS